MAYEKSWTEGVYSNDDVKRIGETLIKKIKENKGTYTAKLGEIGEICGYKFNDDGMLENYGGLFKAIQVAKRQYNIQSINKGRKGNMYCLKEVSKEKSAYDEDLEVLESIKSIMETIDFEKITTDKAIRMLKLIKKILV
ncbi:hypothetical protein [Clostridium sp. 'White wine YQ']|uniref:hypothetical protein n=1 Tax=Clostridium sp. 'White wine YQ' TaxID=3027474 RepID=UPI002365E792|nr:hypothetical protein [Clostridium sp. 'White wine YQ']MDD7793829.1 hypothetical protein [Clostridium sp. 'White wine YQ']